MAPTIVESTDPKQAMIPHQRSWVRHRQSKSLEHGGVFLFTDGSSLGSYAAVIVQENGESPGDAPRAYEFSGFEKPSKTRNIAAELNAVILGCGALAINTTVTIVYDYFGIGAWLTGNWKIKEPDVQERIDKIKGLITSRQLRVRFVHHNGHQKDESDFTRWNCTVDELCTKRAQAESDLIGGIGSLKT